MHMGELVRSVAIKANISNRLADVAVGAVFAAIADAMMAGERVNVANFGIFEAKCRNERTGRNPHTGEAVHIPARVVPGFKPHKQLSDKILNKFESPRDSSAK